jgi:hypothetical protein
MKDSNARRNMPNVKTAITTRKTFFSMQSPPVLILTTEGKAHPLNYLLGLHNITKFTIHTYFVQ